MGGDAKFCVSTVSGLCHIAVLLIALYKVVKAIINNYELMDCYWVNGLMSDN